MYDIQFGLCDEPEFNWNFARYVQSQMREALEFIITYEDVVEKFRSGQPLVTADRERLHEHADDFFPEFFDRDEIPDTMRELYTIIISEDRYIPSVVEEYVLAAAIETMADTARIGDASFITPMPERDKAIDVMKKYYIDEMGDSSREAEKAAEDFIRSIENYSGIIETCFYDTDYMFLDDYSPEDIVMAGADHESGMGVMEPARKRMPDGKLEYIGKPMEKDYFTIKLKLKN